MGAGGVIWGCGESFWGRGCRLWVWGVVWGQGASFGGGGHHHLWVCVRCRRWALGAVVMHVVGVVRVVGVVHVVVVMGVAMGIAAVVVVVLVVIVVVGVGIGSGGGGGGGRSNRDGCDMSCMIIKHMLHKQTTGIPLRSVPVNSTKHSGLNSRKPKFRWNDQAPE